MARWPFHPRKPRAGETEPPQQEEPESCSGCECEDKEEEIVFRMRLFNMEFGGYQLKLTKEIKL